MDAFCATLNDLIVSAFRSVLKLEEQTLAGMENVGISIGEFHLIEVVGEGGEKTVSEIARELSLSLPSVTVAVNKLEKKGYLQKRRSDEDGRMVFIALTERGTRLERLHQHFHEQMVRSVAAEMTEEERASLLSGMGKLNAYFDEKLASIAAHNQKQARNV